MKKISLAQFKAQLLAYLLDQEIELVPHSLEMIRMANSIPALGDLLSEIFDEAAPGMILEMLLSPDEPAESPRLQSEEVVEYLRESDASEIQTITLNLAIISNNAYEAAKDEAWLDASYFFRQAAKSISHRAGN